MKKTLSLFLSLAIALSLVVPAFAEITNGAGGDTTTVSYTGTGNAVWTVTVPAALTAGGDSGEVIASGSWASNQTLTVTASETIDLVCDLNANDKEIVAVTFASISQLGSDTTDFNYVDENTDRRVKALISVAAPQSALFGTWTGTIYYNVSLKGPELANEATIASVEDWNTFVAAWNAGGVYSADVTVDFHNYDIDFNNSPVTPLGTEDKPFTGTIKNATFLNTVSSVLGNLKNAKVVGLNFKNLDVSEGSFFQSLNGVTFENVSIENASMQYACLFGDVSDVTLKNISISYGYFKALFNKLDAEEIPFVENSLFYEVEVYDGFVISGSATELDWSVLQGITNYSEP